ncbi:MAG: hypothetical protein AMS24_02410 [Chlamydiae bacterium SM23_39]|nr:MAG: hypothetical protein AMS24_02410 [Chlamydiae bacterium SM23_39]
MSYHFIGIGGIGMSGLAELLINKKIKVTGSDVERNYIIEKLIKRGIKITIGHKKENLKDQIVVYSTAINSDNEELIYAKKKGLKVIHRSELLKELMDGYDAILIAGSHGKTTTASLLSQVLLDAEKDPSFAIGGVLRSKNVNSKFGRGKHFVCETDESDGSFLNLSGSFSILTNVEKEHLSYWKSLSNLKKGFFDFIKKIKKDIFYCYEDPILREISKGISYGFSEKADLFIDNVRFKDFISIFDIHFKGKIYKNVKLNLLGYHNVLNSSAVFGLSLLLGIEEKILRESFFNFQGVKRRMEKIGDFKKVLFFDDYAHHPTEIKCTLKALRDAVEERKIIAVFQPHRFSRFKELFEEFCFSFDEADQVIVNDIYSASEKPLDIKAEDLAKKIGCQYIAKENLLDISKILKPYDVIIFLGAGDISKIGKDIFERFKKDPNKLKLNIFFGGKSVEHEISLLSAKNIYKNLDKSLYEIRLFKISKEGELNLVEEDFKKYKKFDFKDILDCHLSFPILHGSFGEDGMIQGFFDTLKIPYVGCDYIASSICINKACAKYLIINENIKTPKFLEIKKSFWKEEKLKFLKEIKNNFSFPLFIKPCNLGSSIGVERIKDYFYLEAVIEKIFFLDDTVLIEEEMVAREIEFAVLGNDKISVSLPGEILNSSGFYDFNNKYGEELNGENTSSTIIPANISNKKIEEGKELAKRIYRILRCKGMARIDFFFKDDQFYFNEVNTIPGFTKSSLYHKMWEKSKIDFGKLLDKLFILAMDKNKRCIKN